MAHKNKTNYSPYKARQKDQLSAVTAQPKRGKHKTPDKIFPLEEANDRLFDLFRNHGFGEYPHSNRRQLAQFYSLLMEVQQRENFTRLTSLKDIGLKHFIDCLMVKQLTTLQFPLMDVGTGPGFPGIPLKIEFPEETIVLAEGVQRRVEFLKHVRETMNLQNLPILGRNINPECFYPVRGVITRAVEDMRNTLGNVIHCLQLGGRVYFMKGPGVDPEIPMAIEAWSEFYKLIEDHHYVLPKTDQERRLIVFEKIKSPMVTDEFLESLGLPDEDDGN
jgi:16S rRNA (guanine527-N7)-methyltransferase